MPSLRLPPLALGISTAFTAAGLYFPACSLPAIESQCFLRCSSVASIPIPSTPAEPRLAFMAIHAALRFSPVSTASSVAGSVFSPLCIFFLPPVAHRQNWRGAGCFQTAFHRSGLSLPPGVATVVVAPPGFRRAFAPCPSDRRAYCILLVLRPFAPSPLSGASSLLWPLLTSPPLSRRRPPRVRCMDFRPVPPDST